MPKSDTWPGGIGLETMTGMDSAGSWDSVLSANSVFSDDSMEHLSAEEKACLMFLEETIESLENEEDSGLSNDEPDQLPGPGNLANKLADLSASMSKSLQKHASKEPVQDFVDTKPMQGYLVPTPLVLASSAPCSALNAKTGVPPDKNLSYKPHFSPPSNKPDLHQKPVAPRVPLEVNGVMPPPTKPRDYSVRKAEGLPRGPLSYEALVHLRRSASTKKTPLCPAIDHTIDLDKRLPVTVEGPNLGYPPRSDRSHSEAYRSKTGPPVIGPKPKRIPANISVKTQNEASVTSDPPFNIKNASDPQVVRLEALQKLGLLRDQEPEKESVVPGPPHVNPSRSPSFCHSQVPTEPKNRPLQSSVSFHHYSRSDQQPAAASEPAQSNGFKATGLERSATLDNHRNGQPATRKPSTSVGYTVMVVPGMGADRKEALRKLGLLKD
ncbi:specifically androgen-regulated gene protein [Cyclopterus lumpus]|uniref:specifically androgen-regulated gene protein n=1 Tax=Cyclopterus lumpus TaxID=8103 RepID=UPI001485D96E|nr:specifically androgen-regulated gene protein [Cyclopterus lumpus]